MAQKVGHLHSPDSTGNVPSMQLLNRHAGAATSYVWAPPFTRAKPYQPADIHFPICIFNLYTLLKGHFMATNGPTP